MQLMESRIATAIRNDYDSFPRQWKGLFESLSSCVEPLDKAESWLTESKWHLSSWKMEPLWPELIKALSQREPCCISNCLQFVPTVQLLPLSLQRNLLTFILHHTLEISTDSLVLLRDCYGNPGSDTIDQWNALHLKQLQNQICLRKDKVIEYKASDIVTTKTRNRITAICETLNNAGSNNFAKNNDLANQRHVAEITPSLMIGSSLHSDLKNQRKRDKTSEDAAIHLLNPSATSGEQDGTTRATVTTMASNTENAMQITSSEITAQSISIISTEHPELSNSRTTKPTSTEYIETTSKMDTGVSDAKCQLPDDLVTTPFHFDLSEKKSSEVRNLKRHAEDSDILRLNVDRVKTVPEFAETEHKRQRMVVSEEETIIEKQNNQMVISSEEENVHLAADLKVKLETVGHAWLHSQKAKDELGFLGNLNNTQMSIACGIMKLEELDTKNLVTVSQDIVQISEHLAITGVAILAKHLFLKKIMDLIHPPSRQLINAVVIFSKTFPRPIVQTILVPVIQGSKFAGPQCSLATSIVKDALNIDNKLECLRNIFKEQILWNTNLTTCVQLLIDSKIQLADSDVTMITSGLQHQACNLSSCPKFAKLLHAFVKKYGNQMTSDHITVLRKVLDLNKTFLKKAVLSAIDRL